MKVEIFPCFLLKIPLHHTVYLWINPFKALRWLAAFLGFFLKLKTFFHHFRSSAIWSLVVFFHIKIPSDYSIIICKVSSADYISKYGFNTACQCKIWKWRKMAILILATAKIEDYQRYIYERILLILHHFSCENVDIPLV